MTRSTQRWTRLAGRSLALLILCGMAGCASVPEQQTYVVLDRYFSAHEKERQAQPTEHILEIHLEAAESEQALIERRLAELEEAQEEAPRHISALQALLAKCESDLVVDLPGNELVAQVRSLLPEAPAALQSGIVAWSREQFPMAIAAWHQDTNVILFREAVRKQKDGIAGAFRQGLEEARREAGQGAFLSAVGKLAEVASYEPAGTELSETVAAVLDVFAADMDARAKSGRYWSLYTVVRHLLEQGEQLRQTAGAETLGQAVYEKARQAREKYWQEIAEHILDLADMYSLLSRQHGLALALCDVVTGLLDEGGTESSPAFRNQLNTMRQPVERARERYREKAAETLRRPVFVAEIRAPFHKEEAELVRLKIWTAIQQALQQPPPGVWGIVLAPLAAAPPDDPESRRNSYVIGEGMLEAVRATEPEAVDEIRFSQESVFAPETVYEVRRQKIVTHHICRRTYRQDARLHGRITIRHAGAVEDVTWALDSENQYAVEQEDEALRKTRFDPVPPAREVTTYRPKEGEGRPQDPDDLLNRLRDQAVEQVVQRFWKMVANRPDEVAELARAAAGHEQQNRWDLAAETWALVGEYHALLLQEKKDAGTAKQWETEIRHAREQAVSAAVRWLAAREGELF